MNNKARTREVIGQWINTMVMEGEGQYAYHLEKFVNANRDHIESVLDGMTLKQMRATLALIVCANGLGHTQYRAFNRKYSEKKLQTPATVLQLVK